MTPDDASRAFEEWWKSIGWIGSKYEIAKMAWSAGQAAQREDDLEWVRAFSAICGCSDKIEKAIQGDEKGTGLNKP